MPPNTTTAGWELRDPPIMNGGDVSGDQISDSYEFTWTKPLTIDGCGLRARITCTFYIADPDVDASPFLECQVEYLLHIDGEDPGSTEQWCDYDYIDVTTYVEFDREQGPLDAAEQAVNDDDWHASDEEWNAHAPDWAHFPQSPLEAAA